MGQGFPDLVVGYKQQTVLVEIKSSEQKRFTNAQLKFMAEWKGSAVVRINDVDGAIRLIKVLEMS
jgi:Holliday junction resolvase